MVPSRRRVRTDHSNIKLLAIWRTPRQQTRPLRRGEAGTGNTPVPRYHQRRAERSADISIELMTWRQHRVPFGPDMVADLQIPRLCTELNRKNCARSSSCCVKGGWWMQATKSAPGLLLHSVPAFATLSATCSSRKANQRQSNANR
jgi:hypothetical protein